MKFSARRFVLSCCAVRTFVLVCFLLSCCFAGVSRASAQPTTQNPTAATAQTPDEARVDQLINECRQLLSKGSFEGIAERGEEALKISQKIGDKGRQARSLLYVALGLFHAGRTEEAIEPFKQSARLAAEVGDKRLQATALNSAATMLQQSGDYPEALHLLNEALDLVREQKDLNGEASQLRNLGGLYLETHDYAKAFDAMQRSLELSRQLKQPRLEYSVQVKLAKLEIARGNYAAALPYFESNLKLESQIKELPLKIETRDVASTAYYHLGNYQKAGEAIAQMLELARAQKVALAEAQALSYLAELQLKLGNHNEAVISATRAAMLFRQSEANPSMEAGVIFTRALAERQLGKTDEALSDLRRAMALLERARLTLLPTESARAEFVAHNSDLFFEAVDLLASQGKSDEALAVSEAYHARAFLDLLVESRANLRGVLPKDLREKEENILKRISATQRELWQEGISTKREQELKRELADAESALEQFQLEVRRSNPRYAALKHLELLPAKRIQSEVLDAHTGLLEYFLGPNKSFVWLVSKDKVSYAVIPSAPDLQQMVTDYRKSIADKSDIKDSANGFAGQSRRLYAALIKPLAADLNSLRRLVIVPDGPLAYLPFESLLSDVKAKEGSGFLLERFAISYEPSASALAAIEKTNRQTETRGIVAFGDPAYPDSAERSPATASTRTATAYLAERGMDLRPLPYTRIEVNDIGALFPAADRKIFLGTEANEMNVKSQSLEKYRYVHFAAHGIVDEENPDRSGVVLSLQNNDAQDGILQMTEIMSLKLNSDLVTLSACRTGLGKVISGEGVLGLTRAFMYAGSRSVAASLWNVNDAATADLMKSFYANLKQGLPKDEALRQAKLRLVHGKQPTWRQAYYWAPFVLIGAN